MQQILVLVGKKDQIAPLAKCLVEKRDYTCVQVEVLLKEYMACGATEEQQKQWEAKECMDNTLVESLVDKALSQIEGKVVLCNYPRSEAQVAMFARKLHVSLLVSVKGEECQDESNSSKRWMACQDMIRCRSKSGKAVQIKCCTAELLEVERQKYFFVMGPPCSGKSACVEQMKKLTGHHVICLREMQMACPDQYVNNLIRLFQSSPHRSFIIDGFFTKVQEYELFREFCGKPQHVFAMQKSKEQVYNGMKCLSQKDQTSIKEAFDCFMENKAALCAALTADGVLSQKTSCALVNAYFHPQLYLAHCEQGQDNFSEFTKTLYFQHNIISIDMSEVDSLGSLKSRVHYSPCNKAYLLHNLSGSKVSLEEIESNIAPLKYLLDFNLNKLDLEQKTAHLAVNYRQDQRSMRLDLSCLKKSLATFEGFTCQRNQWGLVLGGIGMGKSEVAKCLAGRVNMKLVEWEGLSGMLKEKLGGEDGPLEELQFKDYLNHFQGEFAQQACLLLDGWTHSEEQLKQMLASCGKPNWVINLKAEKAEVVMAFKRRREMEPDAEMQEEDVAACDGAVASQHQLACFLEDTSQNTFNMDFFNVTVQSGLGKLLQNVVCIFQKRVVALLGGEGAVDQVQAVGYNNHMTVVNLQALVAQELAREDETVLKAALEKEWQMAQSGYNKTHLPQYSQEVLCQVVKQALSREIIQPRDILLLGFPRNSPSCHALEELKALEDGVGEVMQIYQVKGHQDTDYKDSIEPAIGEQPKVKVEGENEDEEEKKDDDEEGKSKFNANLFAWSKQSGECKHLAQVFNRFKQPSVECINVESGLAQCLDSLLCSYQSQPCHKLVFLN